MFCLGEEGMDDIAWPASETGLLENMHEVLIRSAWGVSHRQDVVPGDDVR